MRFPRHQERETAIDMSPLIDMVFILLIFFMVSTTFAKDLQIDIERPSAASAVVASSKSLRIALSSRGEVNIDGVNIKPWMLQTRVREFLAEGTSQSVLVITDRKVAAEKLIEVVDQCRLAGASEVGVATVAEAG